ncbi:MAG TPA: addiction module protein [Thermoanaerobaculia bacterium]|jgi:putative addiction module component (TIGR02574 family)|nr:addiction module protein [Thermoanaerobaculia bacterium]
MTRDDIQRTALGLPANERRELVEVLWESLESDPEPLPEWQRRLLDERLAALEASPEVGEPWDEVEKRIWADQE